MSITTLEKLLPHLDVRDLSQLEIHLTKRLALDLFDFVKSKDITEQKMCNWFEEIVSFPINLRCLVTKLHRLKRNVKKKKTYKRKFPR